MKLSGRYCSGMLVGVQTSSMKSPEQALVVKVGRSLLHVRLRDGSSLAVHESDIRPAGKGVA